MNNFSSGDIIENIAIFLSFAIFFTISHIKQLLRATSGFYFEKKMPRQQRQHALQRLSRFNGRDVGMHAGLKYSDMKDP